MRIATIQQYAVFTEYLTLLSFESFHIGLVREMFTPLQSTVNEATRGIRRSNTHDALRPAVQPILGYRKLVIRWQKWLPCSFPLWWTEFPLNFRQLPTGDTGDYFPEKLRHFELPAHFTRDKIDCTLVAAAKDPYYNIIPLWSTTH
jgi:hypothetical protein